MNPLLTKPSAENCVKCGEEAVGDYIHPLEGRLPMCVKHGRQMESNFKRLYQRMEESRAIPSAKAAAATGPAETPRHAERARVARPGRNAPCPECGVKLKKCECPYPGDPVTRERGRHASADKGDSKIVIARARVILPGEQAA